MIKYNSNDINKWYDGETSINKMYYNGNVAFQRVTSEAPPPPPPPSYKTQYLTVVPLEDGTIYTHQNARGDFYYSLDSGATWLTYTDGELSVTSGNKIMYKGSNISTIGTNGIFRIYSLNDTRFDVEGNIMSLLYGDNFSGQTTVPDKAFMALFNGATSLISAENLELLATTVGASGYTNMFNSCISLTTAPKELPATTLADSSYKNMFYDCKALTTAPSVLSATTLGNQCYDMMFNGCTALTTVQENMLPATTLATTCYGSMFKACKSLTSAPKLPATALTNSCYSAMFSGCTSLTTAPMLPATTLPSSCYSYMFQNCSKLNSITCLATSKQSNSTQNWVRSVASSGTFTKHPNATIWGSGANGIPNGWTVQDYSE